MESTRHSLQDQLLLPSSSSSSTLLDSSSYAAATSTAGSAHVCWTPNTILNSGAFGSYANAAGEALVNSRNPRLQNDVIISSLDSSMTQDLSFDWADSTGSTTFTNNPSSHHDLQLSQIKRELSDSYSKFSEMISSPSSTIEDMQNQPITGYTKKEHRDINDMNVKLLLRTLSSGGQNSSGLQSCPEDFYCSSSTSPDPVPPHRGTFSQIYPTINVSNFSQTSLSNSSSTFDMNLQALDLFHSARFGGSLRQSLQDQLELSRSGLSYGLDYMKQSIQRPMTSSNMTVPFSSGVAETKRSDVLSEPKAPQAAAKRSRLESRASCTPFKVRKEKLGDRIAALQQLVAPFGKTDTASVLMEAIGYIKFLQSQVEGTSELGLIQKSQKTLSVPYLKSSRNKTQRVVQGGPAENGNEERKRDLRSRGLCLVPLSCLSYMTESGGAVWPPPNFGGGT